MGRYRHNTPPNRECRNANADFLIHTGPDEVLVASVTEEVKLLSFLVSVNANALLWSSIR